MMWCNDVVCLQTLVSLGANLHRRDKRLKTALDWAVTGHASFCYVLTRAWQMSSGMFSAAMTLIDLGAEWPDYTNQHHDISLGLSKAVGGISVEALDPLPVEAQTFLYITSSFTRGEQQGTPSGRFQLASWNFGASTPVGGIQADAAVDAASRYAMHCRWWSCVQSGGCSFGLVAAALGAAKGPASRSRAIVGLGSRRMVA